MKVIFFSKNETGRHWLQSLLQTAPRPLSVSFWVFQYASSSQAEPSSVVWLVNKSGTGDAQAVP